MRVAYERNADRERLEALHAKGYTLDERSGLIAEALGDFRKFCGILDIITKEGKRAPLTLNSIQAAYLAEASPRDVILKPRQIGMTTVLLARDLYRFLTFDGARVVVVCQSMSDGGPVTLLARTIRLFFDSLRDAGLNVPLDTDKHNEWSLKGGNATLRIVVAGASEAAAQKVGRAGTITHLHLTEIAYWEWAVQTFTALAGCVPGPEAGSEIVIESTPNGVGGFYYDRWQGAVRGANGYRAHFFKWWEHAGYALPLEPGEVVTPQDDVEKKLVEMGVTPEQIKWYRRTAAELGKDKTLQEFPTDPDTCFLLSGRPFFDIDLTTKMLRSAQRPIGTDYHGALRIWARPVPGANYAIGVDTAEGQSEDNKADHADFCGAIVYDRKGAHVATLHGRFAPWELARLVASLGRMYNEAQIAVERNNHGHTVLRALEVEQHYPNIFYSPYDKKAGWYTTPVTRPQMLDALEDAHRRGYFKTNDERLLGEMRTFVIGPNGKAEAASGAHDDLVMAAAIGWAVICMPMGATRDLSALRPMR